MNVSRGRLVICTAVLTLVLGAASAALAQDPNLDMSRPIVGTAGIAVDGLRPPSAPSPNGAGFGSAATWIAASKFAIRLLSTTPVLTFDGSHYYNSPGSTSPNRYYAQIDLEPGVAFWGLTCVYNDSSATNDVYTSAQKYTIDIGSGAGTGSVLGSHTSSGSGGYGYGPISFSAPETFTPYPGGLTINHYYLSADIANDTSFAGCLLWWYRQVSPAPGTASFGDVPTSHPYFQFIEALKASGITSGCGTGTNYCPGDPVTRGQMAVFLARGLGLFWPN